MDFHTVHKLLILAHSPEYYRKLGKIVAEGKKIPVETLFDTYAGLLMNALKIRATPKKNANVLQHAMGYFKQQLSSEEKKELLEIIHQYQSSLIPLIVPVTLINHYVLKYKESYLSGQRYLKPHPIELQLRNHV